MIFQSHFGKNLVRILRVKLPIVRIRSKISITYVNYLYIFFNNLFFSPKLREFSKSLWEGYGVGFTYENTYFTY